jgi:S1-C subfamily serine protease
MSETVRSMPRYSRFMVLALVLTATSSGADDPPKINHDLTFRPSVIVRQGQSLGTGVIIASVEGETLIVTASHVVDGSGPIEIEIHRFHLGLERTRTATGFPRRLSSKLVARDVDADLAILQIKGELAFPYVAKLASGAAVPAEGTQVMSIGFDRGERLIGVNTRAKSVEKLDMGHGGGERDFLVTEDPPEVGRSGGGLFRADGTLVGVCVARVELEKGRKFGLFAPLANVRGLIESDEKLAATLVRSRRRTLISAR